MEKAAKLEKVELEKVQKNSTLDNLVETSDLDLD